MSSNDQARSSSEDLSSHVSIPPPNLLAEYEKFLPGVSNKIIDEYTNLRIQRMLNAEKNVERDIKFKKFSLGLSVASLVTLFGAGSIMALAGHDAAAAMISFGGLATGAITSYYARLNSKDSERFILETDRLLASQAPLLSDNLDPHPVDGAEEGANG